MEPGNLRQQTVSAVADFHRLQGDQPAALLFVQAEQEHIDMVVIRSIGVVLVPSAAGTLTSSLSILHGQPSFDVLEMAQTT
jgi:hypothetical protein